MHTLFVDYSILYSIDREEVILYFRKEFRVFNQIEKHIDREHICVNKNQRDIFIFYPFIYLIKY